MSVLHKTMATGLIALTLAGASLATATTADAHPRDAFWGGLAAGVVGGALLSEAPAPPTPFIRPTPSIALIPSMGPITGRTIAISNGGTIAGASPIASKYALNRASASGAA